jgi:hypothetical protein
VKGRPALLGRFLLSRRSGRIAAWVLDRLYPAHGAAARVAVALAKRSPALARAHTAPADRSLTALAEEVAGVIGTPADWVLTVPGEGDRRGRYTLFALGEGRSGRPRLERVVKLRRETDSRPLAAEADALESLAPLLSTLPEPLRGTVPQVLARRSAANGDETGKTGKSGGWEVLELSALAGRSAYVEQAGAFRRAALAARHLHAAGSWLAAFQRATVRRGAPWEPPAWEEIAPSPEEPRPEWHRRLEAEAEEHPLPTTAGHGDFWARNLLLPQGGAGPDEAAGVVDWEHFRPQAPPFEDLFHFAWTYARGAAGWHRPEGEAFARGFLGDGELSREIRRYLFEHARETGGDAGALGDLFRTWLLRRSRVDPYRGLEEAGRSVFSG